MTTTEKFRCSKCDHWHDEFTPCPHVHDAMCDQVNPNCPKPCEQACIGAYCGCSFEDETDTLIP